MSNQYFKYKTEDGTEINVILKGCGPVLGGNFFNTGDWIWYYQSGYPVTPYVGDGGGPVLGGNFFNTGDWIWYYQSGYPVTSYVGDGGGPVLGGNFEPEVA
jgi:hypothetical protein